MSTGIEVRHCVRWNEDFGTTGAWDPTGCTLIETDALQTKCECVHFGAQVLLKLRTRLRDFLAHKVV